MRGALLDRCGRRECYDWGIADGQVMTTAPTFLDRRGFLAGCCGAAAGLCAAARLAGAQNSGSDPELTSLGEGLALITGAGGNIVVLENSAGLLLIDTGQAAMAQAVRALLDEHFPGRAVATIFNTHWHTDHTGGNEALGSQAGAIIAHENTRLWMSTTFSVDWEDKRYVPRPAAAVPTETFFSSDPQPRELRFGDERIMYGQLRQAHTDGDIYVHLPERNVVVAGGTVSVGRYPVIDYITGGWIGGMAEAAQVLMSLSDQGTQIIPDAGMPVGRGDVQAQHAMLVTVRERIEAIALQGLGIDDMLAAGITEEFDSRYGDPELFVTNAYQSMWWNRLRGIVA